MPQPTVPQEKIRTIAQALLAKTRASQVNWSEGVRPEPHYYVDLPHSKITLTFTSPSLEPDYITLDLLNEYEVSVASWRVEKPDSASSNPDWDILESLYTHVHRAVTKWDEVLNEVEEALAGTKPIGLNDY